MPLLARTRIGRDLRTTIPREVRELLGITEGDILEWVYEDGRIYVRRGVRGVVIRVVVRCPYCDFEGELGEFRLLKTWRYRWWDSLLYECPMCDGRFRYHVDPTGRRKSFVMRSGAYARGSRGGN